MGSAKRRSRKEEAAILERAGTLLEFIMTNSYMLRNSDVSMLDHMALKRYGAPFFYLTAAQQNDVWVNMDPPEKMLRIASHLLVDWPNDFHRAPGVVEWMKLHPEDALPRDTRHAYHELVYQ